MKLVGLAVLASSIICSAATACMRPQIDERAVQWSTAIVEARLISIDPEVKLSGETMERRGALGALGTATTSYFYRIYQFEVTRTIDGPLKVGQKVPILRLFSRTKEPLTGCAQHLSAQSVEKEFLLLLRPMSQFKMMVPQGVKPPDLAGAMWIVHLEPKDSLSPSALKDLDRTIEGVRAIEQQATADRIKQLVSQTENATSDAQAGPSIRALQRLGPVVLPAVQQVLSTNPRGPLRTRLMQVVSDVSPPEPILMIEAEKPAMDTRK